MRNRPVVGIRTTLVHLVLIILVAALFCLPTLLVGVPESGDGSTHVMYLYHFTQQFWQGDYYPRWLAESNRGYGSPIFLIQYPFPYFAAALLRPVLNFAANSGREAHELGIYCFLMLAGAGLSARVWYRHRSGPLASTIGAVVYIAVPYVVGQAIYQRVSIGELAGFIWIPMMFALCDRIQPLRFSVLSAIAMLFALLVCSNVLIAALFAPVILLYAMMASGPAAGVSAPHGMLRRVVSLLSALVLGTGVAATYALPMLAYHRLFDAAAVPRNHPYAELGRSLVSITRTDFSQYHIVIPGLAVAVCLTVIAIYYGVGSTEQPLSRFLALATLALGAVLLIPGAGPLLTMFSHLPVTGFESYNGFVARMFFTAFFTLILALLAYSRIAEERKDNHVRLLLIVCCGSFFFLTPWSAVLWRFIPGLGATIQFPWRFCAILTVAGGELFALGVADALHSRAPGKPSFLLLLSMAIVVSAAGNVIWGVHSKFLHPASPQVDLTRNVDPMYPTYIPSPELGAFASSVGTSPGTWNVTPAPFAPGVSIDVTSGKGTTSVTRDGPRKLLVSTESQRPLRLRIGLLYFPLWKLVPLEPGLGATSPMPSAERLTAVQIGPGKHRFSLVFDGGWPVRWGDVVTVLSLGLISVGLSVTVLFGRRAGKKKSRPGNDLVVQ